MTSRTALIPLVSGIATEFLTCLPAGHVHDQVSAIVEGLGHPMRIAVAGRVSTGKSTLVNALLEQGIAATSGRETTQVVARYEYGAYEEVLMRFRDGTSRALSLGLRGQLPESLGVNP